MDNNRLDIIFKSRGSVSGIVNRQERVQSTSNIEAVNIITRKISGKRRTLMLDPQADTLRQLQHELTAMSLNFENLQSIIFVTTYRQTLQEIVALCEKVCQRMEDVEPQNEIMPAESNNSQHDNGREH